MTAVWCLDQTDEKRDCARRVIYPTSPRHVAFFLHWRKPFTRADGGLMQGRRSWWLSPRATTVENDDAPARVGSGVRPRVASA